jgi:hypothetical protein
MNKTELAIIEQIALLDEGQQERVLEVARRLVNEKMQKSFSLGEWLVLARQSRAELRAKYGDNHFNSQAILDELREETSEWPPKS